MTGLRERRMKETRRAIERSALTLYRSQGFHNTTIDELCAHAEVGRRTFFRYFGSKEDVLLSRLRVDSQRIGEVFRNAESQEKLLPVLLRAAAAVLQTDDDYRVFAGVVLDVPELRSLYLGMLADFEDELCKLVAARPGARPDTEPPRLVAALAVAGFRVGLREWIDDTAGSAPLVIVERVMTQALRAVDVS